MKIVCDACSAKYSIADEKVRGKVFKIRCKKCSNIIVVRGSSGEDGQQQFDQKETKVFDYAGYDGAGADDAVWHVVIDQEQVGPMTVREVAEKFSRGEVDADTYVWREGFSDWERLASLEPFAGIVGGGGDAGVAMFGGDAAAAAMFGSSADGDEAGSQNDPGDLFAAQAGGVPEDEPGADLFAAPSLAGAGATRAVSAPGASYDDGGGLFARSGNGAGGGGGAEVQADSSSALTGQRNENSVLFSLNNLASLASDAPPKSAVSASAPVSTSSGGGGGGGGGGGMPGEGSGLIDIRAMAQVYLGDERPAKGAPVGRGSADDLPVFSPPSYDTASPVLLPSTMGAPATSNKVMIALMGAIGILALVAVILAVIVLRGGDDDDERDRVASVTESETAGVGSATAGGTDTAGATKPDEEKAGEAAGEAENNGSDNGSGEAKAGEGAAEAGKAAAAVPEERKAKPEDKERDKSREERDRERKEKKEREKAEREASAKSSPVPDPVERKSPTSSGGCDELECLVDPDKACCRGRGGKKPAREKPESSGGGSDLPEQLSRNDISSGIGKVRGRVASCGEKAGFQGKVTVKIKIGGDGRVSSASASGATGAVHSCVVSAVKSASFRRTQKGMSVSYPFVIR